MSSFATKVAFTLKLLNAGLGLTLTTLTLLIIVIICEVAVNVSLLESVTTTSNLYLPSARFCAVKESLVFEGFCIVGEPITLGTPIRLILVKVYFTEYGAVPLLQLASHCMLFPLTKVAVVVKELNGLEVTLETKVPPLETLLNIVIVEVVELNVLLLASVTSTTNLYLPSARFCAV